MEGETTTESLLWFTRALARARTDLRLVTPAVCRQNRCGNKLDGAKFSTSLSDAPRHHFVAATIKMSELNVNFHMLGVQDEQATVETLPPGRENGLQQPRTDVANTGKPSLSGSRHSKMVEIHRHN